MSNLQQLEKDAQALRTAVNNNNTSQAQQLLPKLKIALTSLPSLPPYGQESSSAQQERTVARHILESATLLSVLEENMTSFERHMTQLKVYYSGLVTDLPPSDLHYPILGTRLLQLLVENRMAEFHNELELIPEAGREDANIAFAIKLEQYLMEGSYKNVLDARSHTPNPFYKFFMTQLLQTVRENLADCAEVAYPSLSIQDAQHMFIFDSASDLKKYIEESRPEWTIRDDSVCFKAPEKSLGASDIPSLKLVGETLSYATELDRIV